MSYHETKTQICGLEFQIEFIFKTGSPVTAISEYPDNDEVEIQLIECLSTDDLDEDLFFEKFEQEFINACFDGLTMERVA